MTVSNRSLGNYDVSFKNHVQNKKTKVRDLEPDCYPLLFKTITYYKDFSITAFTIKAQIHVRLQESKKKGKKEKEKIDGNVKTKGVKHQEHYITWK